MLAIAWCSVLPPSSRATLKSLRCLCKIHDAPPSSSHTQGHDFEVTVALRELSFRVFDVNARASNPHMQGHDFEAIMAVRELSLDTYDANTRANSHVPWHAFTMGSYACTKRSTGSQFALARP
ncbi:uncharacterized protein ATNIH1004_005475 [Aspergillus tanneri]|uniref:Uncharacterized protein n=1 Tax=Aspergillus tanneri TaxID=1220188 RepID=A0A5M9MNC9_9EURO|nr:uncharacterized protein ATNIH1004_005475 [Aspergillus tanneri]KAA8646800.1 hypothetical protein ATNIH1004_005475 [Aspergillus tanneri]